VESVKIGLMGLGTVGSGVVRLLEDNGSLIARKLGFPLEISKILVRDPQKPRAVEVDPSLLTSNPDDLLDNPQLPIVVEVMGGTSPAREYVLKALRRGKSVVTANKDLLALYGEELFQAAREGGGDLFFEASVGGGIPIIRPLKVCLAANRFKEVIGIVNGTTNYILTKMSREGREFQEALQEAQRLGYAEADPSADIEGDDAARKLAILASVAFNSRVTYPQVYREGIKNVAPQDILYAAELGYAVKLLAIAKDWGDRIEARVHPALIPFSHPLANVHDEFNAVFVVGDAAGELMFYGRGAGSLPTASAVVGDVMEAAINYKQGIRGRILCTCFYRKGIKPMEEVETSYYLRLLAEDRPGVLAQIARVFGEHKVSLASVIQKRLVGEFAELVFVTHLAREENMRRALKLLHHLPVVKAISCLLRVEERGD